MWNGTFHISKNELDKKNSINFEKESYIIAIVDNVDDNNKTDIKIINCPENHDLFWLEPDSYLATYKSNHTKKHETNWREEIQIQSNSNQFNNPKNNYSPKSSNWRNFNNDNNDNKKKYNNDKRYPNNNYKNSNFNYNYAENNCSSNSSNWRNFNNVSKSQNPRSGYDKTY